jgi:nicotinate-nucleotide adenylyltransferase
MAPPRIGILGGTFDPIHLGHLIPAEYACGHLGLDRLYLVPSAAPVHRPRHTPASPEHRLRMCELAAEPIPPFAVSDCELRRSEPSYTILTLEHFARTAGPDATIFLLIGEDNLPLLHTWHRIADIVALATLAILPRPKKGTGSFSGRSEKVPVPFFGRNPQSAIRIPSPLVPISSTDIRRRVREGRSIAGLVPASVADYIARHSLYRS